MADEHRHAREVVSRRLDGETVDDAGADAHLLTCADCRAWQQRAGFLQRTVANSLLTPPPGLDEHLVASVTGRVRRTDRAVLALRAAVACIAVLGLALATPALIFGSDDGVEIHVAHESGSFDVAIALGFLAAAVWPRRARGVLAVVGVAAALLVITAGDDVIAGRTTVDHEWPHLVTALGALLTWLLARRTPELAPSTPVFTVARDSEGADAEPPARRRTWLTG